MTNFFINNNNFVKYQSQSYKDNYEMLFPNKKIKKKYLYGYIFFLNIRKYRYIKNDKS